MSGRRDWRRAKQQKRDTARKDPVEIAVHPNSMAARKMGLTTWRSFHQK